MPRSASNIRAEDVPAPYNATQWETEAYQLGWNHGHGFACHNVPKLGAKLWTDGLGRVTVDPDNIREVHASLCYEAESNSRQFSPFEFIAHNFNEAGDNADSLWEAFDAGIADSISADLATYTDSDYGIEESEG